MATFARDISDKARGSVLIIDIIAFAARIAGSAPKSCLVIS